MDKMTVHGFSRVQIKESGEVVADSGWCGPNQITNDGILNFLVKLLGNSAGSIQVSHVALGTGTQPAAAGTALEGEIMSSTQRQTVTFANSGSNTAHFTATFASSDSFATTAYTLQNIGLFGTSTGGTVFAGNTYTTSSLNTNQDVNITYQIRFSTA